MNEQKIENLVGTIQLGAEMREFCKHPGFQVLMRFISGKVADSRNEWLTAPTAVAAEEIRLKTKPYVEIENYLKKLLIEGEVASQNLHSLQNLQD